MKPDIRCPVCLAEFNLDSIRAGGHLHCPACETTLAPILLRNDGYIKANWQDLRMLAIFAKRWAAHFDTTKKGNRDTIVALNNICKALERFQPSGAQPLLGNNDELMKPTKPLSPLVIFELMRAPKKLPDGSVLSPWQIRP